jgi:hypothetical protein
MRICQEHWDKCRDAVERHGMSGLVAKNGEEALDNIEAELKGAEPPFDPLMSMNWFFMNQALANGGLYLMSLDENGKPYCPLCEFAKHVPALTPEEWIEETAVSQAKFCREQGLLPQVS